MVELEDDVAPKSSKALWFAIAGGVGLLALIGFLVFGSSGTEDAIPQATVATNNAPLPSTTVVSEPPPPEAEPAKVQREKPPKSEERKADPKPEATSAPKAKDPKKPEAKVAPAKPEPPPEPDPADKKVEKVFLTSRPSGARVTLDGRSVGKTPVEVEIRGKAKVELTLDGYKPLEKLVRLAEVQGTVNFQLQAAAGGSGSSVGQIFLSSSPAGAEIILEGRVIGKTPKMVELPAGNRTLNLRSGALSQTIQIDVKEGQNPARHVPL
jgi:outer membrane biosynthesis protein TonB